MAKATLIPSTGSVPAVDVKKVVVQLTASQINNLFYTPVEAIPAPGVGKCILVRSTTIKHEFGTVEFGTIPTLAHGADPTAMDSLIISYDVVMQNGADQKRFFANPPDFTNWPLRENQPVFISAGGAMIPEGDGSATVVVEYTIEDY